MKTKTRVEKDLSPIQKMFADAIDYKALDKALKDPKVIEILNKVR